MKELSLFFLNMAFTEAGLPAIRVTRRVKDRKERLALLGFQKVGSDRHYHVPVDIWELTAERFAAMMQRGVTSGS